MSGVHVGPAFHDYATTMLETGKNEVADDVVEVGAIVLGLGLSMAGCLGSSMGLILQKLSHLTLAKEAYGDGVVERYGGYWVAKDLQWWGGLGCLILAGMLTAGSLALCPLGLIAPLSGLTIGTNALFAYWILGEEMHPIEVRGTAVVMLGVICTSVFGVHSEVRYTSSQLLDLFGAPLMTVQYTITAICLLSSVMVFLGKYYGTVLESFAYASAGAILGANQSLFLKACMELMRDSQFGNPITYLLLFLTISAAVLQLVCLNLGLARHPAVKFLPVYQSGLTVYGVIAGGIYFKEFYSYEISTWVMCPVGILLVLFGLYLFTLAPDAEPLFVEPEDIEFIPSPRSSPKPSPSNSPGSGSDEDRIPLMSQEIRDQLGQGDKASKSHGSMLRPLAETDELAAMDETSKDETSKS